MRTLPLVLGTALLALSGCTLNTDYFGDYRGKNILSNYDFNALEADGTTPKWESKTLGLNATVPTADHYMTWENVATAGHPEDGVAGTPTAGPSGTPVYRLEIKNLIPDGDFEKEADAGTGVGTAVTVFPGTVNAAWSTRIVGPKYRFSSAHPDNADPSVVTSFTPPGTIDHISMLFSGQLGGDLVQLSLNGALGTANYGPDDLWKPGEYRIRLNFVNATALVNLGLGLDSGLLHDLGVTDADNAGVWTVGGLTPVSATFPARASVLSVSQTFTMSSPPGLRFLTIGASGTNDLGQDAAVVDNVRLVQSDLDLSATASFPSIASGSLPLLPGSKAGAYIFTIQVHDDPTANQWAGLGHALNRFYPSGLTITVRGRSKNSANAVLVSQFIPRPSAGWTAWTKITLNGGLDFVNADSDLGGSPALVLSLSPTNAIDDSTGGKDVGSLLVTEPTLTFNP